MTKLNVLLVDADLTFVFSGGTTLPENELNFSAVSIISAILKMSFTGGPAQTAPMHFFIDYFDEDTNEWKVLGDLCQPWCGTRYCSEGSLEKDITSTLVLNPRLRYRARVALGTFVIYYSGLHITATIELDYTGGTPEGEGYTTTYISGSENFAQIAQLLDLVMTITFTSIIVGFMLNVMEVGLFE